MNKDYGILQRIINTFLPVILHTPQNNMFNNFLKKHVHKKLL